MKYIRVVHLLFLRIWKGNTNMIRKLGFIFCLFVWLLFQNSSVSFSAAADELLTHPNWSFVSVGLVPVQSGGRIKPLDTFAREIVLFETGSRTYKNWNSLDLIFSWLASPNYWSREPIIRVNREDVRRQLGLSEKQVFFTPEELMNNPILAQYAERIGHANPQSSPPGGAQKVDPREQELKAVIDRLGTFHGVITGNAWLIVPQTTPAPWGSLISSEKEGDFIRNQFANLVRSYQNGNEPEFQRHSLILKSAVEKEIPNFDEAYQSKVLAESIYNRSRPFLFSWIFYLGAGAAWIFRQRVKNAKNGDGVFQKATRWVAILFSGLAISSHIFGFSLRCYVAGRPPVTNMYESVIWVSLGVMIFAIILYGLHRQAFILSVASILAALGLIAGDAAPAMLDPSIHPLVPVLRSNYWLTVHVLTITLSYAAFALTFGLANVTLFYFAKNEKNPKTISLLNQITYRATQFGVVLIAAGTILGGIWADYSWGRFWGWDPKEVWALITLLTYITILHGRYTNWVSQFGFAMCSALSFLTVLMAWYGVNFILGVGLHSYGFSTGGTPWVIGFIGLEGIYLVTVSVLHWRPSLFQNPKAAFSLNSK